MSLNCNDFSIHYRYVSHFQITEEEVYFNCRIKKKKKSPLRVNRRHTTELRGQDLYFWDTGSGRGD